MKVTFKDPPIEELFNDGRTKDARYKLLCRDQRFIEAFQDRVMLMMSVANILDLRKFSYLHYEKLKYRPESSIRILNGRVERLIFTETEDGLEVELIEIDKDHYGKKR